MTGVEAKMTGVVVAVGCMPKLAGLVNVSAAIDEDRLCAAIHR